MKKEKIEKGLKKEWKNIIFNLIFAVLAFISVIIFYKNILLTTIILIVITLISLIKWKSKLTILIFIIGAICGPIAEIIAISFKVWQYPYFNILSIPLWLFILWGDAAAFLYQTAIEIKKLGIARK